MGQSAGGSQRSSFISDTELLVNSRILTRSLLPRQKMSNDRTGQLRDLLEVLQEISREIMWVNDREEEELMFDWGEKNIDQYIPKKQESYSVGKTSDGVT